MLSVPGRPWGPVAALRSLRPHSHRWLPMRCRVPGCPVRCDIVNTTPSGAGAERPQDVLNYNRVIHIRMLTDCGRVGSNGDGAAAPRLELGRPCTDECGRRVRQSTAAVDEGCRARSSGPPEPPDLRRIVGASPPLSGCRRRVAIRRTRPARVVAIRRAGWPRGGRDPENPSAPADGVRDGGDRSRSAPAVSAAHRADGASRRARVPQSSR